MTKVTPNSQIPIVNPSWTKPKKGQKGLTKTEKLQQIAYPISTYTYVVVQAHPNQAALLQQFLTFAISPRRAEEGRPAGLRAASRAGGHGRDDDDQGPLAVKRAHIR